MKLKYLEIPTEKWIEEIPKSKEFPRHWKTLVDIEVTLSDGYILKVKKGNIFDGASVPKFLWWLIKPKDKGIFGDWIHDCLWVNKKEQLERFNYNIFESRKFADEERLKWREYLVPEKKIKNIITHKFIRWIGGFYYSRQLNIPK